MEFTAIGTDYDVTAGSRLAGGPVGNGKAIGRAVHADGDGT
ncbi:hypothetical protein [Streptomyces sp. NPDC050538]